MDVVVNAPGLDAPVALLERAVRAALAEPDAGGGVVELSLTLLPDHEMRALNRAYRGRDRATDVLAFALGEEETLGDVYIGVDRARAQAEEHGITLEEELVRLAIHGTLHVLGHDHPEGGDRTESAMFALQERLVQAVLDGS